MPPTFLLILIVMFAIYSVTCHPFLYLGSALVMGAIGERVLSPYRLFRSFIVRAMAALLVSFVAVGAVLIAVPGMRTSCETFEYVVSGGKR